MQIASAADYLNGSDTAPQHREGDDGDHEQLRYVSLTTPLQRQVFELLGA